MLTTIQKSSENKSTRTSEPSLEERQQTAASTRNRTRDDASQSFSTSPPLDNGDQAQFERMGLPGFASFTKALAHDSKGFVNIDSFQSLLEAVQTGSQAAFEKVQLGGGDRLLANPLNAYSHQLIGDDSNGSRMAPAPKFNSRNTAVDMVERYWMALCRDVPFEQYESSPLITAACEDLNRLNFEQEFGFACTPQTLFRASYPGAQVGPHVSQFLLQSYSFGNQPIIQRQPYPREGLDYLTDLDSWLSVNNGDVNPTGSDDLLGGGGRFISTMRDAGQWVHLDFPFQSGLGAAVNLSGRAATTSADPYGNGAISTSESFGSLGGPDITIHTGLAAVYGLKHAWFQKWRVHRRLRPEVYAQRLELFRRGELGTPGNDTLNDAKFNEVFGEGAEVWRTTQVLDQIFQHNKAQNLAQKRGNRDGTWLLPIAYPEGSPTHPSYPGGHSAFIAAAATIAKAFFADDELAAAVPTGDGTSQISFDGPPLTIHGELNKLISNITLFRDGAGMHWRTDGTAAGPQANTGNAASELVTGGNVLGEKMAISMLRDLRRTYREEVGAFEFRALDGSLQSI